jgi:hypothetical protein
MILQCKFVFILKITQISSMSYNAGYDPEDLGLNLHRRENLKSCTVMLLHYL